MKYFIKHKFNSHDGIIRNIHNPLDPINIGWSFIQGKINEFSLSMARRVILNIKQKYPTSFSNPEICPILE